MVAASKVEKRIAAYGSELEHAERKAAAAMHDDCTADELAEAVREYAQAIDAVPAPILAMEQLMSDSTAIVEALAAAGVRFASPENAPAQIAGSAYAAWMLNHRSPGGSAADWTLVTTMFAEGIVHAIHQKTGVPPAASAMLGNPKPR